MADEENNIIIKLVVEGLDEIRAGFDSIGKNVSGAFSRVDSAFANISQSLSGISDSVRAHQEGLKAVSTELEHSGQKGAEAGEKLKTAGETGVKAFEGVKGAVEGTLSTLNTLSATSAIQTFEGLGVAIRGVLSGLGPVGSALGIATAGFTALTGAIGAATYGLYEFVKSGGEAAQAITTLAENAGASVTQIVQLRSVFDDAGVGAENLGQILRIMGVTIAAVWPDIIRDSRDAAENITKNNIAIAEASSEVALSQDKVTEAYIHATEAQRAVTTASEAIQTSYIAARESTLSLASAQQTVEESSLKLKSAREAVSDAEEKIRYHYQDSIEAAESVEKAEYALQRARGAPRDKELEAQFKIQDAENALTAAIKRQADVRKEGERQEEALKSAKLAQLNTEREAERSVLALQTERIKNVQAQRAPQEAELNYQTKLIELNKANAEVANAENEKKLTAFKLEDAQKKKRDDALKSATEVAKSLRGDPDSVLTAADRALVDVHTLTEAIFLSTQKVGTAFKDMVPPTAVEGLAALAKNFNLLTTAQQAAVARQTLGRGFTPEEERFLRTNPQRFQDIVDKKVQPTDEEKKIVESITEATNKQIALNAAVAKFSTAIEEAKISASSVFSEDFTKGINSVTTSLKDSHSELSQFAKEIGTNIGPLIHDVFAILSGNTGKIQLQWVKDAVSAFQELGGAIKDIASALKELSSIAGPVFTFLNKISGAGSPDSLPTAGSIGATLRPSEQVQSEYFKQLKDKRATLEDERRAIVQTQPLQSANVNDPIAKAAKVEYETRLAKKDAEISKLDTEINAPISPNDRRVGPSKDQIEAGKAKTTSKVQEAFPTTNVPTVIPTPVGTLISSGPTQIQNSVSSILQSVNNVVPPALKEAITTVFPTLSAFKETNASAAEKSKESISKETATKETVTETAKATGDAVSKSLEGPTQDVTIAGDGLQQAARDLSRAADDLSKAAGAQGGGQQGDSAGAPATSTAPSVGGGPSGSPSASPFGNVGPGGAGVVHSVGGRLVPGPIGTSESTLIAGGGPITVPGAAPITSPSAPIVQPGATEIANAPGAIESRSHTLRDGTKVIEVGKQSSTEKSSEGRVSQKTDNAIQTRTYTRSDGTKVIQVEKATPNIPPKSETEQQKKTFGDLSSVSSGLTTGRTEQGALAMLTPEQIKEALAKPQYKDLPDKEIKDNQDQSVYSEGGHVQGEGTKTSDSIPAWLSNNEYVVKADAVEHYGVERLHEINDMKAPKFALGGLVRSITNSISNISSHFAEGGRVTTFNERRDSKSQDGTINVNKYAIGGLVSASRSAFNTINSMFAPISHLAEGGLVTNNSFVNNNKKDEFKSVISNDEQKSLSVNNMNKYAFGGLVKATRNAFSTINSMFAPSYSTGGHVNLSDRIQYFTNNVQRLASGGISFGGGILSGLSDTLQTFSQNFSIANSSLSQKLMPDSPLFNEGNNVMNQGTFGSNSLHPLTLVINGQSFDGLNVSQETAKVLTQFAIDRQMTSTGNKPSWVR